LTYDPTFSEIPHNKKTSWRKKKKHPSWTLGNRFDVKKEFLFRTKKKQKRSITQSENISPINNVKPSGNE
jgi:hypothetical protein